MVNINKYNFNSNGRAKMPKKKLKIMFTFVTLTEMLAYIVQNGTIIVSSKNTLDSVTACLVCSENKCKRFF